jgi:hypothetical protein
MPNLQQNFQGSFVETTNVWADTSGIYDLQQESRELKELLVKLYQNLNIISIVLNTKETGQYFNGEFVNSQVYFPNPALNSLSTTTPVPRQVIRMTVICGALKNAGVTQVAHGVPYNAAYTSTRIYGSATDPVGLNYIPIPYASPTPANCIEVYADATYVYITTGSNRTNFTICNVVLEYITT